MKKLIIIALAAIFTVPAYSQLDKKEKKKLKKDILKKMKDMDALDLEEMYNEYPAMKGRVSSLTKEVSDLQEEVDKVNKQKSECTARVEELEGELEEAKSNQGSGMSVMDSIAAAAGAGAPSGSAGSGAPKMVEGLVYKVQIGAFRNKDLSKYFDNHPNFGGEVDADGTQKFTIGQFRKYWEADTFKKYLREMGVKDAWIVAYRDGKRISMKEARESETGAGN